MPSAVLDTRHVLAALQERWGQKIILRGSEIELSPRLSTGFASLDALLSGGVPTGRISEFIGCPTSGKTTVALSILASAQRHGAIAVIFDPASRADPDYHTRMGISIVDLLVVRASLEQAASMLRDIAASRIPCAVLVDLPHRLTHRETSAVAHELRSLTPILVNTQTLILVLSPSPLSLVPQAHVRLVFARESWITAEGDVTGCRVNVLVKREAGGSGEKQATLELAFPDSFAGGAP